MKLIRAHRNTISVTALFLAWLGLWLSWIPHRTAALSQNVFYLSEWGSIIPEVRYGGQNFLPEAARLAVSLSVVALAWSAATIKRRGVRWLFVALAAIPLLVILPPYPDILQMWRSEFHGMRFIISVAGLVGVGASLMAGMLPALARQLITISASAAGLTAGMWSFAKLRPFFEGYYHDSFGPGGGLVLFCAALLAVIAIQVMPFGGRKQTSQDGDPGQPV